MGSHIWHKHKITAREYKQTYGLDYNYPLISKEVKEKKQARFAERRDYYLNNIMTASVAYRFKKGEVNKNRTSPQSMKRYLKQLGEFDTEGTCPVCKMKYKHLQSHLYNKHRLIQVPIGL